MKGMPLCFLLLLAVCFAGASYAQDATVLSPRIDSRTVDSSRKDSFKRDSLKKEWFRANSSKPRSDFSAEHFADGVENRLSFNVKPDVPVSLDSSCAYMRTYRVKRQARGSDGVVPAGYTTCVPTGRFEMRSAVETITDSGGEK